MCEKELFEIQKKIKETVKDSEIDLKTAIETLLGIIKETEKLTGNTSVEFYNIAAVANEAIGDVYMKAQKTEEANKAFLEMLKMSEKLYEFDKEKFDYRFGFSNYKAASFYRVAALQITSLVQEPMKFTEQQKKIYELTEKLYESAIAYTWEHAKKGILRYVELHALTMSELVLLYVAAGDYDKAIAKGKDCVKMDNAVYQKTDDKAHSFRLANRMNTLATVYTFVKNINLAIEAMEDSIFVLEEHEEEAPIEFGMMLARTYLCLAGCYTQIPEEASKAEETYQQGLKRMVAVNQKTNNQLINDVIAGYMIVGDYYKKVKKGETAKAYYRWALKLASDLWDATKNPKYEAIIKRLTPFV